MIITSMASPRETSERGFADTFYWIALADTNHSAHRLALTLTSERVYYRWGPVAPRDRVASLVDANGYFWHDWAAERRIEPKEVELELRAQIERAYAMGFVRRTWIPTSTGCTTMAKIYSRCCCGSRMRRTCRFLWCGIGLRSIRIWSPA